MISHINARFRKSFQQLPNNIKEKSKKSYKQWKKDPFHPSLEFKRVHPTIDVYSVRIGLNWRALGIRKKEIIVWFWIGSHEDYNKLVSQIRKRLTDYVSSSQTPNQ